MRAVLKTWLVAQPHIRQALAQLAELLHPLGHDLLGAEDAAVVLHALAEVGPQLLHRVPVPALLPACQAGHGPVQARRSERW